MLDRSSIRRALQDLGLHMTAKDNEGREDYCDQIYDAMGLIAQRIEATEINHLVSELIAADGGRRYQYIVVDDYDEKTGCTHLIIPLDYQWCGSRVHFFDIVGNKARIEAEVQRCIYAAHEHLMSQKMWIAGPSNFRPNVPNTHTVHEISLGDMYSLRIWAYNRTLPPNTFPHAVVKTKAANSLRPTTTEKEETTNAYRTVASNQQRRMHGLYRTGFDRAVRDRDLRESADLWSRDR